MEPNIQILNPPIEEHYQHKDFEKKRGLEASIKLSLAFEGLQDDPKRLEQVIGIKRNKVKFKYKMRNGLDLSPSSDKLKLFDTLTKDIQSVRSMRKATLERDDTILGMSPNPPILVRNNSGLSNKTILTVKEKEEFNKIWDEPFYVIFMEDGTNMKDKKTKRVKVDISAYVRKY